MAENPSSSPELNRSGTTGGHHRADAGAPAPRRRRRAEQGGRLRYVLILTAALALAYVLDQLTKWWVVNTMVEGQSIEVLPPVLSWHFIRNSGAAFSIGEDVTWIFTIIQAAVPLLIFWISRKLRSVWWSIALGLVAGGALGNLTDRLFREPSFGVGHVVDFIAFPHFAIFNIADCAVVGGVILICLLTLKGIGLDGVSEIARAAAGEELNGTPETGQTER